MYWSETKVLLVLGQRTSTHHEYCINQRTDNTLEQKEKGQTLIYKTEVKEF